MKKKNKKNSIVDVRLGYKYPSGLNKILLCIQFLQFTIEYIKNEKVIIRIFLQKIDDKTWVFIKNWQILTVFFYCLLQIIQPAIHQSPFYKDAVFRKFRKAIMKNRKIELS